MLAGAPEAAPWTILAASDDRASFYAGAAEIALYRTETGQYRDNLASGGRHCGWCCGRPEPSRRIEIVAVTADPAEGECFTRGRRRSRGGLADAGRRCSAIVEAFVAEHHVERTFVKRKRDRADPRGAGAARADRKDHDDERGLS